jgi:ATP citrate (pro-S)-lyase
MARKKIREYDSKRLLKAHILRLRNIKLPLNVTQVSRAKAPLAVSFWRKS